MSKENLFKELKTLGIEKNNTLLIHSSFKSLGKTSFTAGELIGHIIEYLKEGTLIFPVLSYKYVNENNLCFNVRETKSCVGYLNETFRTEFDVIRSIHPTHSVCAIGKYAREITKYHELDNTPCGKNSPFSLLPEFNGKILMLGCGLKPNTSMHAIEEHFIPDYLFGQNQNYKIINEKGFEYEKEYVTHNFKGVKQRYDRIINTNDDLWIKEGKIFDAKSFVMDAITLWKKASEQLEKDKNYFVDFE